MGKALYTYLVLFVVVFVYHALSFPLVEYLIPAYLLIIPYSIDKKINLQPSVRDALIGLAASAVLLMPLYLALYMTGRSFNLISAKAVVFQLFAISLPEEVYFRGFLQERLGNNIKGLIIASILFSIMHIPQFIFHGDVYCLLTFLPSLVMGFLYMKTSNVLPSAIFHFMSNVVFLGFVL